MKETVNQNKNRKCLRRAQRTFAFILSNLPTSDNLLMKNLFFTLAFSLFAGAFAFAQTFNMHPGTVSVNAPGDEYLVDVHNEMENLTNTARTIEWVRTILVNPDSLQTQVCDPVACYAPWISTRTLHLGRRHDHQQDCLPAKP